MTHTAVALPADSPPDVAPTMRSAHLVTGGGLLLMAALAGSGNVIVQGMVTPSDPARTAADIAGSAGLFRLAVATLLLAVALDVLVAWGLYRVFSAVSGDIARLAAWFRVAYAAVFAVAVSQLAGVPDLLTGGGYAEVFSAPELQRQVMVSVDAFTNIWSAGLLLFGVHLLLVGYLALRSTYVPRVIGVLLVVAGIGYAFDTLVTVFSDGSPFAVSSVTFLGEFLFGVWLLVRGWRVPSNLARS